MSGVLIRFPFQHRGGRLRARSMSTKKVVVGSVLIAVIFLGSVHYFAPGGWSWISVWLQQFASATSGWAGSLVTVPVWLLCTISTILVLALVAGAWAVAKRLGKHGAEPRPAITSAEIFGIRWRWNYHEGDIRDIASFCPECDRQVQPKEETRHGFLRLISYQCECGRWRSKSFHCSTVDFVDRVQRTIAQEIRRETTV